MECATLSPTERLFSRLWDRVDTSGECWRYVGGTRVKGGYAMAFSHRAGRVTVLQLVHRVVCEVVHGIPEGMEARHLCLTPDCVHPEHVVPGTRADNERDKNPYRLAHDRRRTLRKGTNIPLPLEGVSRITDAAR